MSLFVVLAGYLIIAYFTLSLLYRLFNALWKFKLGSMLGFSEKFKPKPNSWAIITGATDGIGLAYAHEFSSKGYHLLLIARNKDKLKNVKSEIDSKSNKHKKEIRTHVADFMQTDIYPSIEKEIKSLDRVDVLINNVGVSYEHPEYFSSPDVVEINKYILNVNSYSCAMMCNIVLPIMEQQKSGVILNIASFSALNPSPLLSIYGASKAFVDTFTRGIAYEYAKKGITIQSVLPGFVVSKMSKVRKPNWITPTAENYVKAQLKTVGLDGQTTGYWSHELQLHFTQHVFPVIYGSSLASNITYSQLKLLRNRALKKQAREAEARAHKD